MNDQSKAEARTIGETLRLVGSSEAFTKRVVLWTLPISIFIAVAFDSNRYGTSRVSWALAGILAHIFATFVMLGLRLVFLPEGPYPPRPAKTLIIFAIGAIIRSLAIGQLSVMFGLASNPEFLYRAFAGALLGTLTLSVTALIAAILKEHDQTQAELASEREALIQARNSAQQLVEQQRLEIQQIVHENIEPAVLEISQNLKNISTNDSVELNASASKISELIDSKLRPLSASLHREQKIEIPRLSAVAKKPSLIALPKMLTLRNVVSPIAIYLVLVVPNTTGAVLYLGYSALPVVMLAYAPLAIILSVFVRLPISKNPIRTGRAFALLSLILALAWTPAIFILRLLGIDVLDRLNLAPTATLGTMMVGLLLTYSVVVDNKRIAYESELRDANLELNLELNRTSQLIWHVRQRAAQTLHGSVQASLTAANMRILGAQVVDEELLEKVRQDLVRATDSLTNLDGPTIDLKTSIFDLVQLWQGVCEVEVIVDEAILTSISGNQVTSYCINEIVKEGVSNAIRHGHAKHVEISVFEDGADSIRIEISNDGDADITDRLGVGSQMLDEIAMSWSRELTDSGVRLIAKVASNSTI
jgi:signal transduction histidine kinase